MTIDPASPEFALLPRQEQARIYRQRGWTIEGLAEEFGVSDSTVKRWTNPETAARHRAKELERWRKKKEAA